MWEGPYITLLVCTQTEQRVAFTELRISKLVSQTIISRLRHTLCTRHSTFFINHLLAVAAILVRSDVARGRTKKHIFFLQNISYLPIY